MTNADFDQIIPNKKHRFEMDMKKVFWHEGLKYTNHKSENSILTGIRRFRSFYGVSPEVLSILWDLMRTKPIGSEPKHLLWCMFFLKNYNKEHVNASIANVDEKTFRLWAWRFVDLLAELSVLDWENRFEKSKYTNIFVTLDGIDCKIREPQPFDRKWFSHKFKAAGVRYEIGISIGGGDIVWVSGGVPCGEWPDLKLAQYSYIHFAKNELTLADKGYRQKKYFKQPSNSAEKKLLARHETLNGRLKEFKILSEPYRHPLKKHPSVFHAIVNVVQTSINNGEILFDA